MITLLYGTSLTRQLVQPFALQVNVGSEVELVRFWSAGLFTPGGVEYQDGNEVHGIEKCLAQDFTIRPNCSRPKQSASVFSFKGRIWGLYKRILRLIKSYRNLSHVVAEIDVFHVHGVSDARFTNQLLIGRSSLPIVVSCWGSDVLRVGKISEIKEQKKLLDRANVVTVSSPEFREIVLAKFGQCLRSKMRIAQFSPDLEGVLRGSREVEGVCFRESHRIGKDKICFGIAHNGHPGNQHLSILSGLDDLDQKLKERLFLVIPMTYGAQPEYVRKIRNKLEQLGIDFVVLTDFMTPTEVVGLRLALDVFVFAPQTDSFSATVSQALAAGVECILGSWLPYKLRTSAGFLYSQIDSPSEVGKALTYVVENYLGDADRQQTNKELSETFFEPAALGKAWKNVYREALDSASF